jgi:hypothetical protein
VLTAVHVLSRDGMPVAAVRAAQFAFKIESVHAWHVTRRGGQTRSLPVPSIAPVALATRRLGCGLLPPVGGERAPDIVGFLELALLVASDEPFIVAGIDQLAFP